MGSSRSGEGIEVRRIIRFIKQELTLYLLIRHILWQEEGILGLLFLIGRIMSSYHKSTSNKHAPMPSALNQSAYASTSTTKESWSEQKVQRSTNSLTKSQKCLKTPNGNSRISSKVTTPRTNVLQMRFGGLLPMEITITMSHVLMMEQSDYGQPSKRNR